MIGAGVLNECLADRRVQSLLVIGRSSCGRTHPKLRELIRTDLFEYGDAPAALTGHDACFFCLGVSSAGMDEASYRTTTLDLTIAAAEALARHNPGMTFCYVSGEGADSTERGRIMWARVKGETENRLLRLTLDAYMFRPGLVQPEDGARSKTPLYRAIYAVLDPLFPLLRRLVPRHVTSTRNLGRAMIRAADGGYAKRILENPDINLLASSD